MSNKRFILQTLVLLQMVLFSVTVNATSSWNNYHWARSSSPFTLIVVDSVTPGWDGVLTVSLDKWSMPGVLNLYIGSDDDSNKARKRCNSVTGQMRVCNAAYGFNGWLGLASIYLDSNGHITKGTAKMNDSYSSYWTPYEKNHVMCQEIGHVFGLGHTSEDRSSQSTCMDYSTDINSQWPNSHDYQLLEDIYMHLDSYDSYDVGSSGEESGVCNAPPGKGCNKNNSAGEVPPMGFRVHRGRSHEIWVAPGKDGGMWIHHITLVPEETYDHLD